MGAITESEFISIHAPRVGSDDRIQQVYGHCPISIHAPRVGSDDSSRAAISSVPNFNPRSPCGERPLETLVDAVERQFQSTLPVWGATADMYKYTPVNL